MPKKKLRTTHTPPQRPVPNGFGLPKEWKAFLTDNPKRIAAIQDVLWLCRKVFLRTGATDKPAERMGFYLGRMCVEEFNEILLLAGNGYGIGALKILRGLYERAVTAAYLLQNLDQGELFVDFHNVHKHKAYQHRRKIPHLAPPLADAVVAQLLADYEAVKANYLTETCSTCKTMRPQPSWSKLDTASMAHKVGKEYADLYYDAFYQPTLQTHTTVASVLSRLIEHPDGTIGFKAEQQRPEAAIAVLLAHKVMLHLLATQNTHFQLGLENDINTCRAAFINAYAPPTP